jgi:protein-arginine kinase activator protein McsA
VQLSPKRVPASRCSATSSWDEDTTIFELQKLLDEAIEREDYSLAAQMRDSLKWVPTCLVRQGEHEVTRRHVADRSRSTTS